MVDVEEDLDEMDMEDVAKQQIVGQLMEDMDTEDMLKVAMLKDDEDTDLGTLLALASSQD
jgi:hypothetical protein